jgi:hypothetical protein
MGNEMRKEGGGSRREEEKTHRSCWTRIAMRGHARKRNVPSTRPPTVNPPRTWSTAMCPPNKSSAYNGT